MIQSKVGYKRRNYMINPNFQLRFMGYIAIAVLLGLGILYVSNSTYFDGLVEQGQGLGLDLEHPYFELIENQRKLLVNIYFVVSGIVFVTLMWSGLILSHRIAGPLFHIGRITKLVVDNEEYNARVHLRKGDFFLELEEFVNNMITHFQDKINDQNRLSVVHIKDIAMVRAHPEFQSLENAKCIEIPDIEGVEIEEGLRRVQGDTKLYLLLLNQFAEDYRNFTKHITHTLASSDIHLAERQAHVLKGAAGNLGAIQVQLLAHQLERLCKENANSDSLTESQKQLSGILETVVNNVRSSLAELNFNQIVE